MRLFLWGRMILISVLALLSITTAVHATSQPIAVDPITGKPKISQVYSLINYNGVSQPGESMNLTWSSHNQLTVKFCNTISWHAPQPAITRSRMIRSRNVTSTRMLCADTDLMAREQQFATGLSEGMRVTHSSPDQTLTFRTQSGSVFVFRSDAFILE